MSSASFAALYAEHSARVRRALVLAGASRDASDDIAQEAFARTYARWRRVRTGTNPAGYVYRVAFREMRRRGHLPEDPDGDVAALGAASADPGPEAQALAGVAAAAAMVAIGSMPPRQRASALLVFAAGLTAEEAGHALGIAGSTVRVHVHRARAVLLALPALAPPTAEVVGAQSAPSSVGGSCGEALVRPSNASNDTSPLPGTGVVAARFDEAAGAWRRM